MANPAIKDLADIDPRASWWKPEHGKVRQYDVAYRTGDQMVVITKKVTGPQVHQTVVEEKYLIPLDERDYLKVVREVQRKYGKTGQKTERAAYEAFKSQYAAVRTTNPDPEGKPFPVYPDLYYVKSKKTGRVVGAPYEKADATRIAKKYGKGYTVVSGTKVKPADLEAVEINWMEADTLGKSRHYHSQDEFEHDGSFEYVTYGSERELTEMYDKGLVRKPRKRRRPHGPAGGTHVAIMTPDGAEAISQWRNRAKNPGAASAEDHYEEQIGDWHLFVYPWGEGAHRFELRNDKTGKTLTGGEPGPRSNAVAAARRIVIRHQSQYTNPSHRKLKSKLLR